MTRMLLVGGGRHLQQLIRERTPGLRTVLLARATGLALTSHVEENDFIALLPEAAPLEQWITTAAWIREQWPFERVVALAEIDQEKAAAIAAALGCEGHDPELVALVHDKHQMRRRLRDAGLSHVLSAKPNDAEDAARQAGALGYPLVVKPNGGRGSAGVRIVHTPGELEDAYAYASEMGQAAGALQPCLAESSPILEQFITGREFSVEAFTHEGGHHIAAITEKFIDEQTRVELGHVVPARVSTSEHQRISDYVTRVLTALSVRHGVTHTEVILTADSVELIETHLRKAGDEILELVADATGWVLDNATVDQAAGKPFVPPPWREEDARAGRHYRDAAAIWFATAPHSGRVSAVTGIEEIRQQEGVKDARALASVGERVSTPRSSLDRIARVRLVAKDSDQAVHRAQRAIAGLRVLVEAEP